MNLYVNSLALDILTLSAPSFVTLDRSSGKEQRMEIKEGRGEYQMMRYFCKKSLRTYKTMTPVITGHMRFLMFNKEQKQKGLLSTNCHFKDLIIYKSNVHSHYHIFIYYYRNIEFKKRSGHIAACTLLPTMNFVSLSSVINLRTSLNYYNGS